MTIPWTAALHLARKLLPIVIDKAPELFKTLERFRTVPPPRDSASADSDFAALYEQIEAHQRTITTQADTIAQLQTALSATRHSLSMAWRILTATILLSLTMIAYLFFRS
jgi:hypothetical protein